MKNKIIFWAGVTIIWVMVVLGSLWVKGYQPQNSRSFTDDEMIRIAVQRSMQSMQSNPTFASFIPAEDGSQYQSLQPAFIIPYKDVNHFLEENPECCRISNEGRVIHVWVNGKIFYKDKSGQIHLSAIKMLSGQYFPQNIRYLP